MSGSYQGHDDPLELSDYRRLFAVQDDLDQVADMGEFTERLTDAVARHFGWSAFVAYCPRTCRKDSGVQSERGAVVEFRDARSGTVSTEALSDWPHVHAVVRACLGMFESECCVVELADLHAVAAPAGRAILDRFMEGLGIRGMVLSTFGFSVGATMHLGVCSEDDELAGPRGRTILARLCRRLTPVLAHCVDHSPPVGAWSLTAREHEVASLVAEGLSDAEIAHRLEVGRPTVRKHLTHAMSKTGCASRTQLAVLWHRAQRPSSDPLRTDRPG